MSALDLLRAFAALGIPAGLLAGALLGPAAAYDGGWGGYGSLRRRAARLGHVALVMLPLIAGFYALASAAWGASLSAAAAWLWVGGSLGLVLTLFGAAWRPGARWLLPVPATAVIAAAAWIGASLFP